MAPEEDTYPSSGKCVCNDVSMCPVYYGTYIITMSCVYFIIHLLCIYMPNNNMYMTSRKPLSSSQNSNFEILNFLRDGGKYMSRL